MTKSGSSRWLSVVAVLWAGGVGAASAQSCFAPATPERLLHSFRGGADGSQPGQGLTLHEGVLYGVTADGGVQNAGAIFRVSQKAGVWSKFPIYFFKGGADGASPTSRPIADSFGALYGVTYFGGAQNQGTVYKLTPPVAPSINWKKTTLYSFTGEADAGRPVDALLMDSAGALYGVTQYRTVFRLTPPAPPATAWNYETLYTFQRGADGWMPRGPLLMRGGALYGVTHDMGDTGGGTVFRLNPPVAPATAWTKTIIHRFPRTVTNSWALSSSLAFDSAGALYGATQSGGAYNRGAVYKLTQDIWTEWRHTALYSFRGLPDGDYPASAVVFDSAGALYGVTSSGGAATPGFGFGAVYKLKPPIAPATDWTQSLVYSFGAAPDGVNPSGALVFDNSGFIYGATYHGGASSKGAVFRLGP